MNGRVGMRYQNSKGLWYEIVDYQCARKMTVRFEESGYEKTTKYCHAVQGNIRDKWAPTVYGVGYTDDIRVKVNGKLIKEYQTWFSMFSRCYDQNNLKLQPTYRGVYVSDGWKHFKNFLPWFYLNYRKGYELDKDLLSNLRGGGVRYSEDTCIFVPSEINKVILDSKAARGTYPVGVNRNSDGKGFVAQMRTVQGMEYLGYFNNVFDAYSAYRDRKHSYLRYLAGRYLETGRICPKTYLGLLAWRVEAFQPSLEKTKTTR